MALCPCHEDRTPSLSVRELVDERVLIHCFGCGASGLEIAREIGIPIADLFPPRSSDSPDGPGGHPPAATHRLQRDLAATAAREALVVAIAMEDWWAGRAVALRDWGRVLVAVRRLRQIAEELA